MATASQAPSTGIPNADEILTLARAFGLTVTVDSASNDTQASHVVRITIPVPVAYAGTELGRAIAADFVAMLWTKGTHKGARGRMGDATAWSAVGSRKLRTLRAVVARVETIGHDSNRYARDAAPLPEDVVDAPHALYIDGELRREGVSAARVRRIVKIRRFRGWIVHQDDQGAICSDNRRYAPMAQPAVTEPQAIDLKGPAIAAWSSKRVKVSELEVGDEFVTRCKWTVLTIDGGTFTAVSNEGQEVTQTVPEDTMVLRTRRALDKLQDQPPVDERKHVRIVNGGTPAIIDTRDALAEMNIAQMEGKRDVRTMSSSRSTAHIVYKDPARGTVELRPATTEDLAPAARPAAKVLAADPIPAGSSVLDGMPGREITREELRIPRSVLAHDAYVVQLRDSGGWILPNHDDTADITRGGVAMVLRRMLDNAPGRARTTLDTDGTVYVSNGRQAARYIPVERFARYRPGTCPGCHTSYAENGDGPCAGGRSVPIRDYGQEAAELLGEGERWVKHFRVFGEEPKTTPVDRAAALDLIVMVLRGEWTVYRADEGGVNLESTTGESGYWLEPLDEEQRAAEAARIRTEAAREAYAHGVRLEAQQLATNQVIEERARKSLAAILAPEAAEGKAGFVFRTNHLAVRLRSVTSDGNDFPLLTESLRLRLEFCGWFAEPAQGHGLRLAPPAEQAMEIVQEGQRRSVAAAHAQALAEHAQR
ncbi:hypothetical protein OHT59_40645 [Streptomyces sp. NBC_00243]|uniref:hypothetical protein n=1 Tax=Streptomyces sp. NBC_00243 TaxID=2975688 RepID=UPI002DD99A37|nr:hypothetical protein [Streptomyces sp. NBC_00243]WRZ24383.1 hypothetical protein OHT59_40645 [Streptomyces sp. NBC_00243]